MNIEDPQVLYALLFIMLWTLPWKGVALWMAARRNHNIWFVLILILNTLAIVDIIYIFFIAKKYTVEVAESAELNKTGQNR